MGKLVALRAVQTILLLGVLRLLRQIDRFRRRGLHPERQLVGVDAGRQIGVLRPASRWLSFSASIRSSLLRCAAASTSAGGLRSRIGLAPLRNQVPW